jgi:hypothetical protein
MASGGLARPIETPIWNRPTTTGNLALQQVFRAKSLKHRYSAPPSYILGSAWEADRGFRGRRAQPRERTARLSVVPSNRAVNGQVGSIARTSGVDAAALPCQLLERSRRSSRRSAGHTGRGACKKIARRTGPRPANQEKIFCTRPSVKNLHFAWVVARRPY